MPRIVCLGCTPTNKAVGVQPKQTILGMLS